MNIESLDPRNIPVLTDAVGPGTMAPAFDIKAIHAALVTEILELSDTLLHQAIRDIEATLFERVFDRLRAQLPELVDRVLREHTGSELAPEKGDG
jgi:hypothetical protein